MYKAKYIRFLLKYFRRKVNYDRHYLLALTNLRVYWKEKWQKNIVRKKNSDTYLTKHLWFSYNLGVGGGGGGGVSVNELKFWVNYDRLFIWLMGRKKWYGDQCKSWSSDGKLRSTKKVVHYLLAPTNLRVYRKEKWQFSILSKTPLNLAW